MSTASDQLCYSDCLVYVVAKGLTSDQCEPLSFFQGNTLPNLIYYALLDIKTIIRLSIPHSILCKNIERSGEEKQVGHKDLEKSNILDTLTATGTTSILNLNRCDGKANN